MSSALPHNQVVFSLRPFISAFFLAKLMLSAEISTPATRSNSGERVIPNRPEPQYVSTRCVGRLAVDPGGKIASLTYSVKGMRIELLFWKNEPPLKEKRNEPTRSNTCALWSVIAMCLPSTAVAAS